jgi:hypothetical protein
MNKDKNQKTTKLGDVKDGLATGFCRGIAIWLVWGVATVLICLAAILGFALHRQSVGERIKPSGTAGQTMQVGQTGGLAIRAIGATDSGFVFKGSPNIFVNREGLSGSKEGDIFRRPPDAVLRDIRIA